MKHFSYIIVILVYKNISDLKECIDSIISHIQNCKIVIVSSFYNTETDAKIYHLAKNLNCDFLSVENKGYGAGNNAGILYVTKNYTFDFLIISNSDIIIKKFNMSIVSQFDILAPKIYTLNGKQQNPILAYHCKLFEFLIYLGFKQNYKLLSFIGFAFNRFLRELILFYIKLFKFKSYPVYAAHGSFVIFSNKVIRQNPILYDENIFLFCEEKTIAKKFKREKLKTIYYPQIQILHKEDGSIKMSSLSINSELKKASIYYYEHYVKGSGNV